LVEGVPNAWGPHPPGITWALSPTTPQVCGVFSRVLLMPIVFHALLMERCLTIAIILYELRWIFVNTNMV